MVKEPLQGKNKGDNFNPVKFGKGEGNMQKKKAVKKAVKASEKPAKRGRPPVEFRKISYHLLLDPRYIKHFKKKAREMGYQHQDLARLALHTMIPDPYHPATTPDLTQLLKRLTSK